MRKWQTTQANTVALSKLSARMAHTVQQVIAKQVHTSTCIRSVPIATTKCQETGYHICTTNSILTVATCAEGTACATTTELQKCGKYGTCFKKGTATPCSAGDTPAAACECSCGGQLFVC